LSFSKYKKYKLKERFIMDVTITKSAIYCPPKLAKKTVYTGTEKISGKRLNEINDWLTRGDTAGEFALTMAIGVGLAAVASGVSVTTAPFAVALSYQADKVYAAMKSASWQTAVAYVGFKLAYSSADISSSLLKKMKNKTAPEIEVSYKFEYKRHGSNDGAYFLTEFDIVEA
jgi:hypothetical protein